MCVVWVQYSLINTGGKFFKRGSFIRGEKQPKNINSDFFKKVIRVDINTTLG